MGLYQTTGAAADRPAKPGPEQAVAAASGQCGALAGARYGLLLLAGTLWLGAQRVHAQATPPLRQSPTTKPSAEPTQPPKGTPSPVIQGSGSPSRPPASEVTAKIRALFDAIVKDDPALAQDSFFPRAAFLLVKDMRDPSRYYDRLRQRFDADIHTLHRTLPGLEHAEFERFELSQRGGLVPPHGEGNLLPYWAARHCQLYYRSGGRLQAFEVRVLISWQDHWYVIHLNEFH